MSEKQEKEIVEEIEILTLSAFLEGVPPNQLVNLSDLAVTRAGQYRNIDYFAAPEIQLHCSHDSCNGVRFFRCISGKDQTLTKDYKYFYVTYKCSNCQQTQKTFSLAAKVAEEFEPEGECYKFGELPTYGPPVPTRLMKLIGPDREIFLKGRRCENQGLGIGAFIYYRRVVDNQKDRILTEIIKVSQKLNIPSDKIDLLQKAKAENQFSRALEMAKDALPESLLINGHSPLLLLHSALSDGVHNKSDEECLELASSVRVILGELSERLSHALKEEAEVAKALTTLLSRKKP